MPQKRMVHLLLGLALFAVATLWLLAAFAPDVLAQGTGGSFGGGSFGGGGGGGSYGGGGGGGSFGGGGGSSWGGGYSGGGYSGGGCDSPGEMICTLLVFAAFFIVPIVIKGMGGARRGPRRPSDHVYAPGPYFLPQMDVSALVLGIDWRARRFIQSRLEELAKEGHTGSPGGLTHLLHETITLLRRAEVSWVYAGVYNTAPGSAQAAEDKFRKVAGDMRSRFRHELVRAADGRTRHREGPEVTASRHEGEGLVVVSLVVAARGELPDISQAADRRHLDHLLRAFGAVTPDRMVALEVIWSPAAENDRMSSAELEQLYPELRKIQGTEGIGRLVCAYCEFPYAAELGACPSCGGPAPQAQGPQGGHG